MSHWIDEVKVVEMKGLSQEKAQYRVVKATPEAGYGRWNCIVSMHCSICGCFLTEVNLHQKYPSSVLKPAHQVTRVGTLYKTGMTALPSSPSYDLWCSQCRQKIGNANHLERGLMTLFPRAITQNSYKAVSPLELRSQEAELLVECGLKVCSPAKLRLLYERMIYSRTYREQLFQEVMQNQVSNFAVESSMLEMLNDILTEEKTVKEAKSTHSVTPTLSAKPHPAQASQLR